jgi:hypothetical protein
MHPGEVNLVSEANLRAAGKGINVAMVLKDLGRDVGLTGWLGEGNQQSFVSLFEERALADHFVRVAGDTRINVKISEQSGRVTDLNLPGLAVQEGDVSALEAALERLAPHTDWFVLAGSLPKGVSPDYCGEVVDFDLLVTIPTNMGDECILRSGFGDDLNYVPTDKNTLQSKVKENIFVIGDATNVPASKAGSVAHFEAEILTENILKYIEGKPLNPEFDGHANCFIETGKGKALLIDFNYDVEPLKGKFPFAGIGPLNLLEESAFNHFGKMAFKWVYWNMLLPARKIPFVTPTMSRAGKKFDKETV